MTFKLKRNVRIADNLGLVAKILARAVASCVARRPSAPYKEAASRPLRRRREDISGTTPPQTLQPQPFNFMHEPIIPR